MGPGAGRRSLPVLRERVPGDVPELVRLLLDQQPVSHYPVRAPLPFPAAEFVARRTDEVAWVAEVDGSLAGHVSVARVSPVPVADRFAAAPARHGSSLAQLTALFVGLDHVGRGLGGLLHDTALAWIVGTGRQPVLEVVDHSGGARGMYARRGWVELDRVRPGWLPDGAPDVVLMAWPLGQPTTSSTK